MVCEIKKISIVIFLVVLNNNFLHAQMQDELKQRIEKYLENTESTSDFTQVLEDLGAYLDKPINLNTATVDELINFPLISQVQAINIVAHRDKFGLFLSLFYQPL